jgi:hypothetical protein
MLDLQCAEISLCCDRVRKKLTTFAHAPLDHPYRCVVIIVTNGGIIIILIFIIVMMILLAAVVIRLENK